MIPIEEAVDIIQADIHPGKPETVRIADTVGRVLREDVVADMDLPPFDRSQMDGYAVRAEDTMQSPTTLEIVGESAAGHGWIGTVSAGQAVRIMTGACVPAGADAVQKLEHAEENDGYVKIMEHTKPGRYIVRRGSEISSGQKVFAQGEIITENMVPVLAAFGYSNAKVGRRPRVAILTTGSEVVDYSQKPGLDQIRNSNSVMLDVLCRKIGAVTTVHPIVPDNIDDLKAEFEKASQNADFLVITGGVSVGKYDLTKAALNDLGARIVIEKLRLKPGKPMVFGRLRNTIVFGLPGNPVSAAVTFHLFVRRAILLWQGAQDPALSEGHAVLDSEVKAAAERDTFLPAKLSTDDAGRLRASSLKYLGSSDFVGFSGANGLIFVPRGTQLASGEIAKIMFL